MNKLVAQSIPSTETRYADYVFLDGIVYTVDTSKPWAEAVAVTDNTIVFVGNSSEIRHLIGPSTRIIPLHGLMMMPGFIDGHNHIISGTYVKRGVKLKGSKDPSEIYKIIREYVQNNQDKESYTGYGLDFSIFGDILPSCHDLDAITSKPFIIWDEYINIVWCNSQAMENACISRETPDPSQFSYYHRDPDGTPTGVITGSQAWLPLARANRIYGGKEKLRECMNDLLPGLPEFGITSCHDMGIWTENGYKEGYLGFELLREWEDQGILPCRISGVYAITRPKKDPEDDFLTLSAWREKYQSNLIDISGIKILTDGVSFCFSAVLLEPYENNTHTCGVSSWDTELISGYIITAYKQGFDVHIHAVGDAIIRNTLNAFEIASPWRRERTRSVIHHISLIHPDDIIRFKQLDICGGTTMEWLATHWDDALSYYGRERRERELNVWKKLIDIGVNVSFGSDIPGTDPDEISPFYQMQVALTGRNSEGTIDVSFPEWRIPTLEQMISGYTMGGAYQMGKEDLIGSISEGKLADLIILDRNIFDLPADELDQTKVLLTMMNGKILFQDLSLTIIYN